MGTQYSEMSQPQIEAFLQVPRFAFVGTNRKDGPPQLTPVWYLYENEKIYLSIFAGSAKYRNLCRDPRISVCVAGNHPDARAVIFTGSAELFLEGSELWEKDIEWRLTRRYYDSDDEARAYLESVSGTGEGALAVVTPEKIISQDFN
jgi:PPOX class probable F420-dependent enzyme